MKYLLSTLITIIAFVLLATASPALAQTPDGETPAQETVCDSLKDSGITKGLYGLCVAFCEAHDAADINEAIDLENLDALLASRPNGRILENYNKRKSETDPDMPCVKVQEPCPCWERADLDRILFTRDDGDFNYDWCNEREWSGRNIYDYSYTRIQEWGGTYDPNYALNYFFQAMAYDFRGSDYYQPIYGDGACRWHSRDQATGEYKQVFLDHLDAETLESCRAQVEDRYIAAGVATCNGYQY